MQSFLVSLIYYSAFSKITPHSRMVQEALIRYMEDQEDMEMAEVVLNNMKGQKMLTLEETRRELGLEE